MPCFARTARSPPPDNIRSCGVWNAPEETMTSRRARICLTSLPWRYSTPTARLPSNRMRLPRAFVSTRRLGRGPILGGRVSPRRAPAFAVFLGDLIDAEAFVILGIKILADPKLRFPRGLQK